jgi:membrane protein DedA with SNARE-associated domain
MMAAGLFFGQMPWVQKHFEAVVIGIIFISMIPVAFEVAVQFLESRKSAR